ncbi:MAG: FG-GAP-like repeat-containing protein, partial [Candidatus Aminicenantes bacterium]|nr:FG-GAP-like repeat-containing protein [Candidatus Aminicenantes bacterium]
MQVAVKKILVLILAFIPLFIAAAVPSPVFKWRNGGFSLKQFNKGMYTSPALLDINQDGVKEIIWANFKVFAFDGITGTALWSFWAGNDRASANTYYGIGTDTNVAVADINNDGFGEIITTHTDGLLCAYDRNGYFLPGFPLRPTGRTDPICSLSVYDLDNDGYFEIIIGWGMANNLNICVISHDGAVKAGWPQYTLDNNANALGIFGENIAVGDINKDGFGELVAPSDTGKTCAYYYDGRALPINPVFNSWMTTWPDVTNYENYASEKFGWEPNGLFYMGTEQPATIADVNADGSFEIVIVGGMYTYPDDGNYQPLYTMPFIYNLDRTRFKNTAYDWESGLPRSGAPLSNDWNFIARKRTNPVVVDLDGDGKKEILSSSFDGKLHCYWLDRTEHGNWPYSVYVPAEGRIRFSSEPAVADLDGDGSLEVIFTSWPQYYSNTGGHLFILNSQGSLLHKVALPYGDNGSVGNLYYDGCLAAPTIGDVDGDGQVEIVLGTVYAGLVVYDLPGAVMGSAPWPTGRHDYSRTGWTDYVSNIAGLDSVQVLAPNGGENWNGGSVHDITWSTTGSGAFVSIDYSINGGSSWISVLADTANDGSYGWTVPATLSANCLVRVSDTDGDPSDVSDRVFSISTSGAETVSTPQPPLGAAFGLAAASCSYFTGGSTSNLGHVVQYKFDWDDGSDSGWLAEDTTQASHSWAAAGTYDVRAMACCAEHTTVESLWSATLSVIIYDGGGTTGSYNSPAQYKVLPEVIWSSATGGGTWMSNVQVTDVSGGSQVSVYYNAASGRRGPFLLWDNSA